jgi:hypothetical protein
MGQVIHLLAPLLFLQVRALVADFSIVFSILLFCGIDACFGLETPKLHVPSVIKVCPLPLLLVLTLRAHQLQILSPLCSPNFFQPKHPVVSLCVPPFLHSLRGL